MKWILVVIGWFAIAVGAGFLLLLALFALGDISLAIVSLNLSLFAEGVAKLLVFACGTGFALLVTIGLLDITAGRPQRSTGAQHTT